MSERRRGLGEACVTVLAVSAEYSGASSLSLYLSLSFAGSLSPSVSLSLSLSLSLAVRIVLPWLALADPTYW